MPSPMIHLLTAYHVAPNKGLRFWIGNIAPDAVVNWQEKELRHLRNSSDRTLAITDLAGTTDQADDFAEGMLLHLFTDWKWDIQVRDDFIKKAGENWFPKYRFELSLAGAYAFHHTDWSKNVWEQMDLFDISSYGKVDGSTAFELKDFIHRNDIWLNENNIGPSIFFPSEFVEPFTKQVAEEYMDWRCINSYHDEKK